jgi:hypothetical protein
MAGLRVPLAFRAPKLLALFYWTKTQFKGQETSSRENFAPITFLNFGIVKASKATSYPYAL